jgi:hypothetical protein
VSDPLFKQQRNKRTGEVRDLLSHDGGQSWMVVPSTLETNDDQPPPAQQQAAHAPQQPPMSSLEMMGELLQRGGEGLYDGAMGAAQGVTMGGADELAGMLPGTSVREQQGLRDQSQQRSPWAYGIGQAAGGALPALASGGATALEQLGMALMQGGATGFLSADGGLDDRSQAGLTGVGKLAPMLSRAANSERAAAFSTPGDFATLARKNGLDYSQSELAQQAEEMGLTNSIIPQSAADYARKAGAVREASGQAYGQAIDDAGAQGAHGYLDPIASGLQTMQRQGAANRSSLGAPREAVATELLDRLGPVNNTMQSPRQLWTLKKELEDAGGYVADDIRNLPTGQGPLVNQEAAGLARRELDSSMELALPETRQAYDTARRQHGFAATIENLANEKAIQDAKPMGLLPTLGWSGAGGAMGGIPGAVAGYGAGKLTRAYGHDAAANALTGGSALAEWAGSMAPGVGKAAGVGSAAAMADKVNSSSRGHEMGDAALQALATDPQSLGPYAQRFQEAQATGDPMELTSLLYDLNDDPEYRRTVGMTLKKATGRPGEF